MDIMGKGGGGRALKATKYISRGFCLRLGAHYSSVSGCARLKKYF
jgi:hypothetical protein